MKRTLNVLFGCLAVLVATQLACAMPGSGPVLDAAEATGAASMAEAGQTQAAIEAAAVTADPKTTVLNAFTMQGSTFPRKVTETLTDSATSDPLTWITEAAGPSEHRITWMASWTSGEWIQTGGFFYLFRDGVWSKTDAAPTDIPIGVDLPLLLTTALVDVQYLGPDSSIGVEAFSYSFTTTTGIEGVFGKGVVWIGTSSGLPYKATYEMPGGDSLMTSEYLYEYGLEVTITPPIP